MLSEPSEVWCVLLSHELDSYGHCRLSDTCNSSVRACSSYACSHLQWLVHLHQCNCHSSHGLHREAHLWPVSTASDTTQTIQMQMLVVWCVLWKTKQFAFRGVSKCCLSHRKSPAYKDSPPEAILVNVLGLLVAAFGGLVLWIATRPSWKRPREEITQTVSNNSTNPEDTKTGTALTTRTHPDLETRRRNGKAEESG